MFALPGNSAASPSLYNRGDVVWGERVPKLLPIVERGHLSGKSVAHFRIMLKAAGKSDYQTGTKILLEAMSKDKVHLARFVLDALDGEIVDSKTDGAQTPLVSSVLLPDAQTRCKFVELLLQRGAKVNCRDGDGRTALSRACENGYLDAVKILVRNNADPEIVDAWGNTALMYAAVAGHCPVVEFLVRAFKRLGLQIDRRNKVGNSAVEAAAFLGHTECIVALSNKFKTSREAQGGAQPRLSSGCRDARDRFDRKVGQLVDKLEVLQTRNAGCILAQNGTWQSRPRIKQRRLPSMDSIGEIDGSSSPTQELVFSGVLTPKPPKTGERLHTSDDHLPPLTRSREAQTSTFFSPRPGTNTPKPSAPSALGTLLTPLLTDRREHENAAVFDFGVRRFHDSYYQKRWSLPVSVLSPTPPGRTPVRLPKSRTARRREASPCRAAAPQSTSPHAAANTTLSVLRNKLLRRFTSPEFKEDVTELEEGPGSTSGRMPRSETFPRGTKHQQVDSKRSVDSISSVKCEFDFPFRMPDS